METREGERRNSEGRELDFSFLENDDGLLLSRSLTDAIKKNGHSVWRSDLKKALKALVATKESGLLTRFQLVFLMEDLGKDLQEKIYSLRFLKAILEDAFLKKYITHIIVKSHDIERDRLIELNVFSSGIDLVVV